MEIPINYPGFEGGALALRVAGFFSGPEIVLNGVPVKAAKGVTVVQDNAGKEVEIRIKAHYIDPVPKIEIGAESIQLARPLTWYEYVWMGLPIILVSQGGALGALIGVGAIYSSARIMRSDAGTLKKYLLSGAISVFSAVCFFIIVSAITSFLPKSGKQYAASGAASYQKGEYDKAIVDFSRVIEAAPNEAGAYSARAGAYYAKGDYGRAAEDLSRVIKIDPKDAAAYSHRAVSYYALKEYEKAIADLSRVIELDPQAGAAYFSRGVVYTEKGDYDKALEDYSRLILMEPNNAKTYIARAGVYAKLGEPEMAAADEEKGRSLPPVK